MDQLDSGHGRVLLAMSLIAAGVTLLVVRTFDVGSFLWPFYIIVPGLAVLGVAATTKWGSKYLAVTGAVVTGTGLILFVQSMTDSYRSWAYAWTLLPLFAGAGLLFFARLTGHAEADVSGRNLITWSAIAFIGFAAVFELLIFPGRGAIGGYIAPAVLIAIGGVLLLGRSRSREGSDPTAGR